MNVRRSWLLATGVLSGVMLLGGAALAGPDHDTSDGQDMMGGHMGQDMMGGHMGGT